MLTNYQYYDKIKQLRTKKKAACLKKLSGRRPYFFVVFILRFSLYVFSAGTEKVYREKSKFNVEFQIITLFSLFAFPDQRDF